MECKRGVRTFGVLALASAVTGLYGAAAIADGGEATGLGVPSIAIGSGSGIVAAGVGLDIGPGTITIDVPGDVVQALLYWSGEGLLAGDDTIYIEIGGSTSSRTGVLIGGPEYFFTFGGNDFFVSTYRDDITDLIVSGANELAVSGLDFGLDFAAAGAGVLVIYDDGSTSDVSLRDGQDLAYAFFAPPLDATVPVAYSYASSPVARTGDLTIFAASVGNGRPNIIRVEYNDGTSVDFVNELSSNDGPLWDTASLPLTIPANTTGVTVEVISYDDETSILPASLTFIASTVSIGLEPFCGDGNVDSGEECDDGNNEDGDGCSANCTIEPFCGDGNVDPGEQCDDGNNEDGDGCDAYCIIEDDDFAGCTPGFWKQPHHLVYWQGYSPNDRYDDVFMVESFSNPKLLKALKTGGGGEKALGRHAVAALLNAANADVNYLYTVEEVIAAVQAAYDSGAFEETKNQLEEQNELGCTAKGDDDKKEDEDDDGGGGPTWRKALESGDASAVPNGAACGAMGMLWLPLGVLGIVGTRRMRR